MVCWHTLSSDGDGDCECVVSMQTLNTLDTLTLQAITEQLLAVRCY